MKDAQARRRIEQQMTTCYPALVNSLIRQAGSKALAQDLIGDAIVRLLEHTDAARLSHFENVAGYVYRTAQGLLANHRRKLENQASLHHDPKALQGLAHPASAADLIEIEEICEDVIETLESLPERDCRVINAAVFELQDRDKVCAEFGLSAEQLAKILSRAIARMKKLIKRRQGD
jgi:RNA polymerase sigma factor (sigma-70 family)